MFLVNEIFCLEDIGGILIKREDGNFDYFVYWLVKEKFILKVYFENVIYNVKYFSFDI